MKKIFGLVFICFLLLCSRVWGVTGTCVDNFANGVYPSQNNGDTFQIVFTWLGNSAGGLVPTTANSIFVNAYVKKVVTDPGTAPAADYDITLIDSATGLDMMGAKLADRSATATQCVRPYDTITTTYPEEGIWVQGTLTLTITNQTENSATGTVTIYCDKRP